MLASTVISVEDNDGDYFIIETALHDCHQGQKLELIRAVDGEAALELLERLLGRAPENHPQLVILDINLPRLNGLQVLQSMKSRAQMRDVPVVMFTSSSSVKEKAHALKLGAQEYITKTADLDNMLEVLADVCGRYLPALRSKNVH